MQYGFSEMQEKPVNYQNQLDEAETNNVRRLNYRQHERDINSQSLLKRGKSAIKKSRALTPKQSKYSPLWANRARGAYVKTPRLSSRRVVVKARFVRGNKNKTDAENKKLIQEHLKYLQREGRGLANDETPKLFNASHDDVAAEDFAELIHQDRHHFRFIVSPENGSELDLQELTRELVTQMQEDLGTKLQWAGVIHADTDNPHAHVIVRGVDELKKDLIINKDYISNGVRSVASNLATQELGLRSQQEVEQGLEKSMQQSRPLAIDYKIHKLAIADDGVIFSAKINGFAPAERGLVAARLQHLESMGLVKEDGLFYKVDKNFVTTLKQTEAQNDIYKRISRFGFSDVKQQLPENTKLVGKVLDKGLHDELGGSYYLIVDGCDGGKWYVQLANNKAALNYNKGDLVYLEPNKRSKNLNYAIKVSKEPRASLMECIRAHDATMLDKCLVKKSIAGQIADTGFGKEFKEALHFREQVLISRGLASPGAMRVHYHDNLIATLKQRAKQNNLAF